MEQHKTFSIVIPAYNYADYLPRAVASVCRQDGDDWDLLVINDGSSDNTEAVIEQLRHHYQDKPDVRFVSQRNAGLSAVRNRGIRETSGDYLVFLDADDELCFDALAHFRQHIAAQPGIYFWIGGYISVHEDGREKTYLPGTIPAEPLARVKSYLLSKRLALRCSAVALHRSVFAAYIYPEQFRSAEDISVFVHVLANFPVAAIGEPVVRMHRHSDSLRHWIDTALDVGLRLVDEIFDSRRLPGDVCALRSVFYTQRCLSLSRTCYGSGDLTNCVHFFKLALARDVSTLLKWSHLKKFLKAGWKLMFAKRD